MFRKIRDFVVRTRGKFVTRVGEHDVRHGIIRGRRSARGVAAVHLVHVRHRRLDHAVFMHDVKNGERHRAENEDARVASNRVQNARRVHDESRRGVHAIGGRLIVVRPKLSHLVRSHELLHVTKPNDGVRHRSSHYKCTIFYFLPPSPRPPSILVIAPMRSDWFNSPPPFSIPSAHS